MGGGERSEDHVSFGISLNKIICIFIHLTNVVTAQVAIKHADLI